MNQQRINTSPLVAHLPNLLTLCNLLCGCIAIVCIFNGQIAVVPYLVIVAAIVDFSDGFVARALKVESPLGLQLDSLADMVTFGVVPGMTIFHLLQNSYPNNSSFAYTAPAFLITLFSALRLAKFNIDTRQTDSFLGLPTPSSTMFVMSLILIINNDRYHLAPIIQQPITLYAITIILSFLLISEIPMFALKIKNTDWDSNKTQILFISYSVCLLGSFGYLGIALIVLSYILLSVAQYMVNKI